MTRIDIGVRALVHALVLSQSAAQGGADCPVTNPCPGNSLTVVESGFVGPQFPGAGFPDVQVLGFDDALGELRSVEITVTLSSSGQRFEFENMDAAFGCPGNPDPSAFHQVMSVTVDDPSSASPLCANPSFAVFQGPIPAMPANTETPPVCDLMGPASIEILAPPQEQVCSLTCIEDHTRLESFKRSSTPLGFVHFDVTSTGFNSVRHGCPNICSGFHGELKVTITATYTYCTEPGAGYCFGDGLDPVVTAPCPCANVGDPGHGCANSFSASGGFLSASGLVSPNTVVFSVTGIPNNSLAVGFRHSGNATPQGVAFGDGVRCQSGTLIRFGAHNSGTNGDAPNAWTSPTATLGAGITRYYQVQYRNSAPAFCPPEAFNITNGYRVTW